MKIRIDRSELLAGLARVQGGVERRNTVPILSNVLIEADDNGVHMFATDLEIGVRGTYRGEVLSPGAVTVSARKLFEIVRELDEGPVELTTTENLVNVSAGRARFRVASLPTADFPPPPETDGETLVPVDRKTFSTMIRKTFFAVGDLDTRYVLNGVLMTLNVEDPEGGSAPFRMVATNGHRLAMIERPVAVDGPVSVSAIVPRKALVELRRLLDEGDGPISLGFTDKRMIFKMEGLTLVSHLVEGTFPSYEKVIPETRVTPVVLPTQEAASAFRRVSLLCQEKTWAVRFSLRDGLLTLAATNPDLGEATCDLSVAYAGEPFSTGFNARYFIDVLANVEGENVEMEIGDPLAPCVVRDAGDPGYLTLIMPMRL